MLHFSFGLSVGSTHTHAYMRTKTDKDTKRIENGKLKIENYRSVDGCRSTVDGKTHAPALAGTPSNLEGELNKNSSPTEGEVGRGGRNCVRVLAHTAPLS